MCQDTSHRQTTAVNIVGAAHQVSNILGVLPGDLLALLPVEHGVGEGLVLGSAGKPSPKYISIVKRYKYSRQH